MPPSVSLLLDFKLKNIHLSDSDDCIPNKASASTKWLRSEDLIRSNDYFSFMQEKTFERKYDKRELIKIRASKNEQSILLIVVCVYLGSLKKVFIGDLPD